MLTMAIAISKDVENSAVTLFAVWFKFICQMAPTAIVQGVGSLLLVALYSLLQTLLMWI